MLSERLYLSHSIIYLSCFTPNSSKKFVHNILDASVAMMYSTSVVHKTIQFCCFDCQERVLPVTVVTNTKVDFLKSLSPAQSASCNHFNSSFPLPKHIHLFIVPRRQQRIHLTAFGCSFLGLECVLYIDCISKNDGQTLGICRMCDLLKTYVHS